MSIKHHPSEDLLIAYAAGRLDEGQSLAIATHLGVAAPAVATLRALEELAGAALEDIEPAALQSGAFDRIAARLSRTLPLCMNARRGRR